MNLYRWCIPAFKKAFLLAALLAGFGLLYAPVQTAAAQSTDGPSTLVKHLRGDLQGNDAMQRQRALLDIIALATCPASCTVGLRSIQDKSIRIENETGTGSVVDLDALVPDLLETYRSGPADGHRLLALSALINIGNEKALERLIDEGASQSKVVNKRTQKSLAGYYLAMYPELTERTLRTRQLSLDDVEKAKAVRVKKMKKAAKAKS